jgi:hypothetical protein
MREGDGVNQNIAQVRFDFYKDKRRFKLIQLGDIIKMMNPVPFFKDSFNSGKPRVRQMESMALKLQHSTEADVTFFMT